MVCRILTVWCTVAFLCVHSTGWSNDYFPMRKGNSWFNIDPHGVKPLDCFYSVGDSLIRKGQVYYVMQYFLRDEGKITYSDTLRNDTLGNVWRYGILQDTLWFDFSDDTTTDYNYGKYSVKKGIVDTIITPSGVYKYCLCLTFIDSASIGYRFIFKDSIGIIDRALFYSGSMEPRNITRLKSAFVNGVLIGTPTNTYDYFPLQIGNVWAYHTEKSLPDTLIHKIEDTVIIDGKVYFRLSVDPLRGKNRAEYLLRKDTITGNVYKRVGQEEELFNTIAFSIIEGEPYFYKSSLSDTAIESWCEATHTVPAGNFDHCRYYKMDNWPGMYDDEYYYIYAPGVGLIADHNDGSIPFFSKLIYAIIDGNYIGPQVDIKLAVALQIPVKNIPRTFVLVKGSHQIFSFNENVQVFSLNGRSMGAINRLPGKGFAQGIFIIKNKQ